MTESTEALAAAVPAATSEEQSQVIIAAPSAEDPKPDEDPALTPPTLVSPPTMISIQGAKDSDWLHRDKLIDLHSLSFDHDLKYGQIRTVQPNLLAEKRKAFALSPLSGQCQLFCGQRTLQVCLSVSLCCSVFMLNCLSTC